MATSDELSGGYAAGPGQASGTVPEDVRTALPIGQCSAHRAHNPHKVMIGTRMYRCTGLTEDEAQAPVRSSDPQTKPGGLGELYGRLAEAEPSLEPAVDAGAAARREALATPPHGFARFHIVRSGSIVAGFGVTFPDGTVVIRWDASTEVHDSMAHAIRAHRSDPGADIVWIDVQGPEVL